MLLRAGGAGVERGYAGLSSLLRAKREPEILLALVARGMFFLRSSGLRSARARGREGCFDSPLPTSGLHSPRNELRAARP